MRVEAGEKARKLAEEIEYILSQKPAVTDKMRFFIILNLAKFLAESALENGSIALKSIETATIKVSSNDNDSSSMAFLAASEMRPRIEERLTLSVINYAITQTVKDAPLDTNNYMAKLTMGLEFLFLAQPEIEWGKKILSSVERITTIRK